MACMAGPSAGLSMACKVALTAAAVLLLLCFAIHNCSHNGHNEPRGVEGAGGSAGGGVVERGAPEAA